MFCANISCCFDYITLGKQKEQKQKKIFARFMQNGEGFLGCYGLYRAPMLAANAWQSTQHVG